MKPPLSMRPYALLFSVAWDEQVASGRRDLEAALRPVVELAQRDERKLAARRAAVRVPRETAADVRERVMAVARPYRAAVALRHGVPLERLKLRMRCGSELQPLQELAWLLRTCTSLSFSEIAVAMERDDHTTALAAYRKAEAAIVERPGLRGELLGLVVGGRGDARIAAVGS